MKYPAENLYYSNCYLWYSNHYTIKHKPNALQLPALHMHAWQTDDRCRPPFLWLFYDFMRTFYDWLLPVLP